MHNKYFLGVVMVLVGGVFLSMSGILLRHVEQANGWQILFYRSLSCFITLVLFLLYEYRSQTLSKFRIIGSRGIIAAVVLSLGSIFYILAMLNTTVANVVFIIGASPLVAALAGWLFLKEKVSLASFITMLAAVAGVGLMFADGVVSGGLLGNVLALMLVFMFVIYILMLRRNKHLDMVPATCLSALLTTVIALFVVDNLTINTNDLIISIALGSVQFGVGFMLLTRGSRYIPAAEVALFALSESVLNPIWVWLGVNEVPSKLTLAGSTIVLVSVITYSIMSIRRERHGWPMS